MTLLNFISEQDVEALDRTAERQSLQSELELMHAKNQAIPRIKQCLEAADIPNHLTADGFDVDMGMTLMAQCALAKRMKIESMGGMALRFAPATEKNPAQWACDEIARLIHEGYLDYDSVRRDIIYVYGPSPEVEREIADYTYPIPMVVEPEPITHNRQTGYQTIKGSVILKSGFNHHDEDVCLDHLNRMNRIPLAINNSVFAFVQNKWASIDRRKVEEGETYPEFRERQKNFKKYMTTCKRVAQTLLVASSRIFFTHRYDKRGRTYCQGYHFNYQGNDWNKACIEFAEKEPLNQ